MLAPARVYTVPIAFTSGVSTPAQVDVFELHAGTSKPIVLISWEFGQTSEIGDAQEEQLELVLKYMTGAVTSGSGGTAAGTPRPVIPGDSAFGGTFENGNTTKATGGTTLEMGRFVWNVRTPSLYVPVPEERIVCADGEDLVLELVQTPADAITKVSGRLVFGELV